MASWLLRFTGGHVAYAVRPQPCDACAENSTNRECIAGEKPGDACIACQLAGCECCTTPNRRPRPPAPQGSEIRNSEPESASRETAAAAVASEPTAATTVHVPPWAGIAHWCFGKRQQAPQGPFQQSDSQQHEAKMSDADSDTTIIGKDYYEILNVPRTASGDEIKKAYRRLAPVLHPDKNLSNPEAELQFKHLVIAYSALNDPEQRRVYDIYGEAVLKGGRWHDNLFTFSPEHSCSGVVLTNNELTATCSVPGTITASRGFWKGQRYWEYCVDTHPGLGGIRVGILRKDPAANINSYLGSDKYGWGWFASGTVEHDGRYLVHNNPSMRFRQGDVLGLHFNLQLAEVRCYINGRWVGKLSRRRFEVGRMLKAKKGYAHTAKFEWIEYLPAVTCSHRHYQVTLRPCPPMPQWEALTMDEDVKRDWDFYAVRQPPRELKRAADVF